MSRSRISRVDHTWLRMDSPFNWMIITGLMTFDTPLDVERLKDTLQRTLLPQFRRFSQHLAWPELRFRRPVWEDDPNFDLDTHIESVTLKPPADQAALQDFISEVMAQPLDISRPLWRYYLIENYGTGSALIARLHHCLADGMALVQVLLSMAETTPGLPAASPTRPPSAATEPDRPKAAPGAWEDTLELLPSAFQSGARAAEDLARIGLRVLGDPFYAIDRARLGTKTAAAAGRLILRWPDPQTVFKGQLGLEKRAVWSDPLRLEEVKLIGRAFGATVNDVLLTSVTGALRCYLQSREERVEGLSIRGIVPVNLRAEGTVHDLGNKFGLVFLSLPLGIEDPIQRLRAIKCCMDGIKDTPEALATYGILGTLGSLHPLLQEYAVSIFDTKGSAVITNVAGPRQKLYLAGAPINTLMAWVPQSGRVSLGVSIISYNGKVWLGIATDKNLVPNPECFIADFKTEFGEMKRRAERKISERGELIRPMLTMLDEALNAIDEVLAVAEPQTASALPQAESALPQAESALPQTASALPQAESALPQAKSAQSHTKPPRTAAPGCQGWTRSGAPCKNSPLPGQVFCRVHQKQAAN